jgi:large subunit ribosomal protein L35
MPKMKTHSASKKRFKKTGSGKIRRAKAFRRHHAWAKTSKQLRCLRGTVEINAANKNNIAVLMPY